MANNKFSIFLLVIGIIGSINCTVNTCKSCTSDNGDNIDCEENLDKVPSTQCSIEFGNEYCYVLVTRQKQPSERWMWNRGCCQVKAGSTICPSDKPNHESNEVYDQWRMKCDTDDCNIENPINNNNGGGNNGGGILVHGKPSGATSTQMSFLVLIFVASLALLK